MEILMLVISLIVILIAAELFVNGIEWLGKLLKLSEGAVGSVLAAVGTALPETLIPIIALISGQAADSEEIGIGAILGAPLMLSTLTMFVTGCAVIAFKHKRKHKDKVVVHYDTVSRDLKFFIVSFSNSNPNLAKLIEVIAIIILPTEPLSSSLLFSKILTPSEKYSTSFIFLLYEAFRLAIRTFFPLSTKEQISFK